MSNLPELFYTPVNRDLIRLTGRDRLSFLQGMVTNETASLTPGQGCYAFHLTSKGQIIADCRIACLEDSVLLDTEPGWGEPLLASLEHHLVMERVKLAPLTGVQTFFIGGALLEERLSELGVRLGASEGSNVTQSVLGEPLTIVRAHWTAQPGVLVYCTESTAATVQEAGETLLEEDRLEGLRIEAGVPRGRIDFDEKTLAPETGQAGRAIHYKKGCYVGQEVVARIDARGHTNRTLVCLTLDQPVPPRTPLVAEGVEVGWVTSCALGPTLGVPVALGYVRNELARVGTMLRCGEATGTLR